MICVGLAQILTLLELSLKTAKITAYMRTTEKISAARNFIGSHEVPDDLSTHRESIQEHDSEEDF